MKNLFSFDPSYDSNLAAKALCQQVLNDLNIDLESRIAFDDIKDLLFDGGIFKKTFRLSTSTLGPFAPAIASMEVTIISNNNWTDKANKSEKVMGITYEYSYTHTNGGSNGKTIRKIFNYKGELDGTF